MKDKVGTIASRPHLPSIPSRLFFIFQSPERQRKPHVKIRPEAKVAFVGLFAALNAPGIDPPEPEPQRSTHNATFPASNRANLFITYLLLPVPELAAQVSSQNSPIVKSSLWNHFHRAICVYSVTAGQKHKPSKGAPFKPPRTGLGFWKPFLHILNLLQKFSHAQKISFPLVTISPSLGSGSDCTEVQS